MVKIHFYSVIVVSRAQPHFLLRRTVSASQNVEFIFMTRRSATLWPTDRWNSLYDRTHTQECDWFVGREACWMNTHSVLF